MISGVISILKRENVCSKHNFNKTYKIQRLCKSNVILSYIGFLISFLVALASQ